MVVLNSNLALGFKVVDDSMPLFHPNISCWKVTHLLLENILCIELVTRSCDNEMQGLKGETGTPLATRTGWMVVCGCLLITGVSMRDSIRERV